MLLPTASHTFLPGCVALFRPHWDWFSSLKKLLNNKKNLQRPHCPWGRAAAALSHNSKHAAYGAFPICFTHTHPSFSTTQTWSWEEAARLSYHLGKPRLEECHSKSWVRLPGSREGGTAEEEEEGAAETEMTTHCSDLCFPER